MTETVPDRVLNFGSDTEKEDSQITPENVEAHADRLPVPTGYRILILPHEPKATTKGGIMLAKQTLEKERIAAIVGLKNTKTGDTLCSKDDPVLLESMDFLDPVISIAVEPASRI